MLLSAGIYVSVYMDTLGVIIRFLIAYSKAPNREE